MSYLDRHYADRSEATKHRLLSEFLRCEKRPEDSMSQHISKLKEKRATRARHHTMQTMFNPNPTLCIQKGQSQ